jgi:hypothetical protein
MTTGRFRQAWRVWRSGLPEATVTYHQEMYGSNTIHLIFAVRYEGRVFGHIDGQDVWSEDGTFTVDQKIRQTWDFTT